MNGLEGRLERACRILGLAEGEDRIEAARSFLEELMQWNRAYNLVGRKLAGEDLVSHFIDSLAPLMCASLFGGKEEMLDLGSGAGFPGIPLMIMAGPLAMTLVEPVRKKQAFLRHIRRKLKLDDLQILGMRCEEMSKKEDFLNAYDRVFMRAVTDPQRAMRLARPLLSSKGVLVLFLGKEAGTSLEKRKKEAQRIGLALESFRSTRRLTGKDNHIALFRKQE